jgi:hypothetical protein
MPAKSALHTSIDDSFLKPICLEEGGRSRETNSSTTKNMFSCAWDLQYLLLTHLYCLPVYHYPFCIDSTFSLYLPVILTLYCYLFQINFSFFLTSSLPYFYFKRHQMFFGGEGRGYFPYCEPRFILAQHRGKPYHQKLKMFTHPQCVVCSEDFQTRLDWEAHRFGSEILHHSKFDLPFSSILDSDPCSVIWPLFVSPCIIAVENFYYYFYFLLIKGCIGLL